MIRELTAIFLLAGAMRVSAGEVHLGDYSAVSGLAVDAAGNMYFAGSRWTSGPPAWTQSQVLTKLDSAGTPVFTTHVGDFTAIVNGEGMGVAVAAVAVDGAGSAYITGYVNKAGLLPIVNARQPVHGGMGDAFVGKLKPDGSGFVYLTYLGGSRNDRGRKIAVDPTVTHMLPATRVRPISPP